MLTSWYFVWFAFWFVTLVAYAGSFGIICATFCSGVKTVLVDSFWWWSDVQGEATVSLRQASFPLLFTITWASPRQSDVEFPMSFFCSPFYYNTDNSFFIVNYWQICFWLIYYCCFFSYYQIKQSLLYPVKLINQILNFTWFRT